MPNRVLAVRQDDSASIDALWSIITSAAVALRPRADGLPMRERHIALARDAAGALVEIPSDPVLAAEHLRHARRTLSAITGEDATEAMLDALFSRFCLGK